MLKNKERILKIIIDDNRTFPLSIYNCVRTYEDCIFLIECFKKISFISLDYDLGSNNNGLDILKYLERNNIFPPHINIHSNHENGKVKMIKFIKEKFPLETVLTQNEL